MSGLTTAQINADIDFIQGDLANNNITETVTIDGTTYTAIRASQLDQEEITAWGWATNYRFSIMIQRSDGMSVSVNEVVTMATEGEMRVLAMEPDSSRTMLTLHLGDKYPARTRA